MPHTPSVFTRPKVVLLLATLCCLLWGSAYPSIKTGYVLLGIGRDDIASQLVFAGYRFIGAGLLLLGLAGLTRKPIFKLPPRTMGQLVLLGVLQTTVQYLFFYIGLAHTTGVKASILSATGVFFSVLLAHLVYHNDRLSWRKLVGCALGFAGVMLVNLGALNAEGWGLDFHLRGEGFVVLSALALSAASLYGKKMSQTMDSMVMTGYQLGFGGLVLLAMGWTGGGALHQFSPTSLLLLAYLAALSATAFALWSVLLKFNRVSTVSVTSFLVPIFGAGLSALFLHESLWAWKNLAALGLVCLGIWWVSQEPANLKTE